MEQEHAVLAVLIGTVSLAALFILGMVAELSVYSPAYVTVKECGINIPVWIYKFYEGGNWEVDLMGAAPYQTPYSLRPKDSVFAHRLCDKPRHYTLDGVIVDVIYTHTYPVEVRDINGRYTTGYVDSEDAACLEITREYLIDHQHENIEYTLVPKGECPSPNIVGELTVDFLEMVQLSLLSNGLNIYYA